MSDALVIEVVRKSVTVGCTVEEAFRVFTTAAASWWPVDGHSIHGAVSEIVIEPFQGGEVYEVSHTGERGHWATVLQWDPPHRLVLAWNIRGADDEPTEVDVRFSDDGSGTRVDLEHRGWERLAADREERRESYDSGWEFVLGKYVDRIA
jgi:uncharacterized protein YndB with AHSA1/START domain